jgi:hypothetical protein
MSMPTRNEANRSAPAKKRSYPAERPYRQSVILLVIGDVMCFLIFAVIGTTSHKEVSGLASIPYIMWVALPFIAGWFLVAPFMGLFKPEMMAAPRAMAIRTALAWIPAWVISMILRGIFYDHGVPAATFMLIALFFNLVILEVWRWPFALNNLARKRGA